MERLNPNNLIDVKIAGIPCCIDVTRYYSERASWYHPGYTEFEFQVYDRKGYRAKWLEAKVTPAIEDELLDVYLSKRG